MATVIVGGGIIGLSTAFYLSELRPDLAEAHQIHIIDSASELLLSSSGYAGGFVAKDWFSSAVASLGELSFRLHKQLAAEHNGAVRWGYARSVAYSLAVDSRGVGRESQSGRDVWLESGSSRSEAARTGTDGQESHPTEGARRNEMLNDDGTPAWFTKQKGGTLDIIDDQDGCAQVVPRQLCEWLIETCQKRGVQIHTKCEASGIIKSPDGKIAGVKVLKDCEVFEKHCENIVIAAGPWTPTAFKKLFPTSKVDIPVRQLAGYSITVRSPRLSKPILDPTKGDKPTSMSHAVYCAPTEHWNFAPEVFSRISSDGRPELWAGGVNDSSLSLPETADGVAALKNKEMEEELKAAMIAMTGLSNEGDNLNINDLEIVKQGLCFRPVSNNGHPVLSQIAAKSLGRDMLMPEGGGVYIASGHGPWGISLSLGTGKVIAELLLHQKPSANVSRLTLR